MSHLWYFSVIDLKERMTELMEKKEMRYNFKEKYCIVNSETMKGLIQKELHGFNTFVALREGEVQESTAPTQWIFRESTNNVKVWITGKKSN